MAQNAIFVRKISKLKSVKLIRVLEMPWKFPRPFYLQAQNGHGNFQDHFIYKHKMILEISKTISAFASTKWSWKFPRPFYNLQAQNGHGNFQDHFSI